MKEEVIMKGCKFYYFAMALVLMTDVAYSETIFDKLDSINEGEWVKLNTNDFNQVWTPNELRTKEVQTNAGSPGSIIKAWSSMAWDSNRHALIFWGGGHANYPGNDVYMWQASSLQWERASLPSEVTLIDRTAGIYEAIDGIYNAPISSHTYDNNEYLPVADRFAVFGGAAYNTGWRFEKDFPSRTATGPYFWDPATADANKVGGSTGSHANAALFPDIIGGLMWENRDNMPDFNLINGTSAYIEENGKDVLYLQSPKNGLWKYKVRNSLDAAQDSFVNVGINWDYAGGQGAGAIDLENNFFLRTGDSAFTIWDIGLNVGAWFNKSVKPQITYLDSGIGWLGGYGMDYDPVRQQFVLWNGKEAVWYTESVSKDRIVVAKKPEPLLSSVPDYGSGTGILGKWKYVAEYDIFIGVSNPISGDIWAYKPEYWLFDGPSILTDSLDSGFVNTYYQQSIDVIGLDDLSWNLVSGLLPEGLSLDTNTGIISGTPLSEGVYPFTISVTDGNDVQTLKDYEVEMINRQFVGISFSADSVSVNHNYVVASFPKKFTTPIVIAGPATRNGSDPGAIRVKNINNTSGTFEIAFKEWEYLDGWHAIEQAATFVIDAGYYSQKNVVIEAGTFPLSGTANYATVSFTSIFPGTPAVYVTAQTANGSQVVAVRVKDVTPGSFKAAFYEQEALMDGHIPETIGYFAIYSDTPTGSFEVDEGGMVNFSLDTKSINHEPVTSLGSSFFIEEERSANSEVNHVFEQVELFHFSLNSKDHWFSQQESSRGGDSATVRMIHP